MAEAYLQDKKLTLPCAVKLDGQYGFKDVYAGVPVIIGSKGVEKIVEIELNDQEKKEFIQAYNRSLKSLFARFSDHSDTRIETPEALLSVDLDLCP